ncbi:hypothetical protein HPB49_015825 [Dermacentor silvarum]|uniref:Uncharacterized protein n=1 Tax=Dermacentor silvarum TaxID=543639 RepID=A0ACB8E259_DERSI|nr:hypothetical protein HPB49_015825 [Dermacentor silvarum]
MVKALKEHNRLMQDQIRTMQTQYNNMQEQNRELREQITLLNKRIDEGAQKGEKEVSQSVSETPRADPPPKKKRVKDVETANNYEQRFDKIEQDMKLIHGVDLSEDYHPYSYSDGVRLAPDVSPVPLPTIIHRSVTKTIRRWRTRGAAVVSPLLTERSSGEPLVDVRSQVAAVSCDDTDGDLFCLGTCPAEERLVRVLRVRQQDVQWHTNRLTLARELRGLKDNAQNRTSAFFLDARTSLVHDTYPKLLWDARHSLREGPVAGDAAPPEVAVFGVYGACRGGAPEIRHTPRAQFPGPAQAVSILEQACWALAVAESAHEFEHRLPVLGTVLVRPTRSPRLEFTLRGRLERISSAGYKIRLQGLQMARMTVGKACCPTGRFRCTVFLLQSVEARFTQPSNAPSRHQTAFPRRFLLENDTPMTLADALNAVISDDDDSMAV